MAEVNDFNQSLIAEFRANNGRVGGYFADRPLLMLTTTGARSGQPRTVPLVYTTDGDRIVLIAANGGAPNNPDWYHNLIANPVATVELPGESFQARASVAAGAERERLYAQMAERIPGLDEYQRKTSRTIPIFILERIR